MKANLRWAHAVRAVSLLTAFGVSPAIAQYEDIRMPRAQIAPFGGYQWGGSFSTDGLGAIPAGSLKIEDSFAWGGIVSFLAQQYTAVELWYLRQDDNIGFQRLGGVDTDLGGFATNYLHIGGRQGFPVSKGVQPFIGGSMGITIFDPKTAGIGTSTRFSFALGAGLQWMTGPQERYGVRTDIRWWVTPVPSGDYGVWCDYWSCYVAEGTEWVDQGQVSAGLVIAF